MVKKRTESENIRIAQAALRLAAQGWDKVTLDAVAKAANITPAALKQRIGTVQDLAPLIAEEIDREAFAAVKPTGTPHDMLFDLLMARFDILQKYRKAILNMENAARHDARLARMLARATMEGSYRITEILKWKKPARPVLAFGIAASYGWAFFHWRKDRSSDMAPTMAALDRALRLSGKAAEILTR